MECQICAACGTQFDGAAKRTACPVCEDERQFVPPTGQRWTGLAALRRTHANTWRRLEPDLFAIETMPAFAIGQRAFLIRTPAGNVLWECIALLDDATGAIVDALGGLAAIAISHPHYYTTMRDWSLRFGCPVWLHDADRGEVRQAGADLRFWTGPLAEPLPGVTLLHAPGHFDGAAMLHWAGGGAGQGALLSGDIIQVMPDRRSVSFMRSYPNMIPLPAASVQRIAEATAPFTFGPIYGAFRDREIPADGKGAIARSMARYVRWIGADR